MTDKAVTTPEVQELRAAITESGLSTRKFAAQVLVRHERTVRRWLAGDSQIPQSVLVWLAKRQEAA